jgi:transposase
MRDDYSGDELCCLASTARDGAQARRLMDGAGWHKAKDLKAPENLSLMFSPPYAPELNPVENIWQFLRQTYLTNQVLEDYDKIVEACCKAWNNLTKEPRRITSIASRK